MLTGCYPKRVLPIPHVLFPAGAVGLNPAERTVAEVLKGAGYATGCIGKWHLGFVKGMRPMDQGFDSYYGVLHNLDHFETDLFKGEGGMPVLRGESVERRPAVPAEMTGLYTDEALKFIESNRDRPFFLYVGHAMPHLPFDASPKFKGRSARGLYGDVVEELDDSTGRILERLRSLGLAENTLVLFTSDNGPWLSFGGDAGSSGGLREGKGTTFEGGVREPCFLRWPGRVPAGAVSDVPWMSIDLFATVAAIVGAPPPAADRPIDGRDARAVWACEPGAKPSQEAYFFYYHTNHLEGVRMGRWKLSLPRRSRTLDGKPGGVDGAEAPYVVKDVPLALFDLEADPAETRDVSAENPEAMAALLAHVERARADLGDALVKREGSGRRPAGGAAR